MDSCNQRGDSLVPCHLELFWCWLCRCKAQLLWIRFNCPGFEVKENGRTCECSYVWWCLLSLCSRLPPQRTPPSSAPSWETLQFLILSGRGMCQWSSSTDRALQKYWWVALYRQNSQTQVVLTLTLVFSFLQCSDTPDSFGQLVLQNESDSFVKIKEVFAI